LARFFINRPVFAIVISIIITLAGLISAINLPIAQYPQISPPQVMVSTTYLGADAETLEQAVGAVIEQQVNGVDGMTYMESSNSNSGMYLLRVQFALEKDGDIAAVQTQNRVAQAEPSLPDEVKQAGILTRKSASEMALIFALWSPNGTYDSNFLKNYGSIYIVEDLKRIKGVGNIQEFGSDYAMRIWLQPDKMARLGVTAAEVASAIKSQNIQAAVGAIGQQPANTEFQYAASAKGRLTTEEEFGNIIVRSRPDGSNIYLRDVAKIEFGSKDYNLRSTVNGRDAAGFAIQLTSDANALETVSQIKAKLAEAAKSFPADLEYKIVVDNTEFIAASIKEVAKTFLEALALVTLVVFIFLQSWRATLIPMLAVPVSIIGTFAAFIALGFSINTLTLFAMVLAIGLVVDDAIVVVEAVEHHIRHNRLSPKEATIRAMDEVAGPVIAIAFVLASVFIPVAFFGGTLGVLYKQFALTITVSMALSALVALSLTPALCVLLMKPYDPNAHAGRLGRFFSRFNTWFDNMLGRYANRLQGCIRQAKLVLASLAVIVVLLGALVNVVPSGFVPNEDQGYFIISLSLPEASNLNRTKAVVDKVVDMLQSQPGVQTVNAISGFDLISFGAKSNAATMFVKMAPWAERKAPELSVDRKVQATLGLNAVVPEARIMAFNPPALPGLGTVGGFTMLLENRGGASLEEMDAVAKEFIAAAQKRPEIGMIYTDFAINTPAYNFKIDREKAQSFGIPPQEVYNTLQIFLGGLQVNDINRFGKVYKVVMQADSNFRGDVSDMRFLYLRSPNGTMVPLDTLVTAEPVTAPASILRFNGVPAVKLNGSPAPGYSSGQAMAALEEIAAQVLPAGFSYAWSGQSLEERKSAGQTPFIFGLALVFAFLCLAALYESWSVPFAVLLSLPTGLFGAFLLQYVRSLQNDVYMQIGLVMLIGLAAKNGILIVEFAKVRVDKGMAVIPAAIEAAKLRLRPILMTSLAFIIGCLPLSLADGAGAAARKSMGTAVVGGMTLATALGIFMIPVLFVVVEWVTAKLQKTKAQDVSISQ